MGGLGFRDFELFNLALLARQAWRILQEPTTLSARVLKAVYFPEKDFFQRILGHPHPEFGELLSMERKFSCRA